MKKFLVFSGFLVLLSVPFPCYTQTSADQLKKIRSTVIEKVDGTDYYIHTIVRGQTLYMISKAYGVEVNDIIRENPQVKDGIKADQKIRIPAPVKKAEFPVDKKAQKISPKDSISKGKDVTVKKEPLITDDKPVMPGPAAALPIPCGNDVASMKSTYNVALMLPLYLDKVGQLDSVNPGTDILDTFVSFQFLPFYEGFRIAIDSLERAGIKVVLWVYDVDKDTLKTQQLLVKPEMKQMDLIVGLLYQRIFLMVADFARKNNINIVNPISERSDIVSGNPRVFKVKPARKRMITEVAAFLAGAGRKGQVLIVRNNKYNDSGAADLLKKTCVEEKLNVQVIDGQDAIADKLSKEKENWIITFSDNATYALEFTRQLFQFRNEYEISLIGLPFWSNLEGLETDYLVGLKTHMVAPYFIDYSNPNVKKFVLRYQQIYKADPSPLAFEGYDIAIYFISALKHFGKNIKSCLGEMSMPLLQTDYIFQYSGENGSENIHWEIYRYDNYKLVKAN